MPPDRDLLSLVQDLRACRHVDASLQALADRAGWSPFYFHRAFRRLLGQTPARYLLRLRIERAARRLATTSDSVLDVAMSAGFGSHEGFARSFRRYFGRTPSAYRRAPVRLAPADVSPCIGLFHVSTTRATRSATMPMQSVGRQTLVPRPVLFVRREVARHEIAAAIGEGLGAVAAYAAKTGLAISGRPFTRYVSVGPGLLQVDVGMPIAAAGASGDGDVQAGLLPGGAAVVALHAGPYDQLGETYAAMERWMQANHVRAGGPMWESYVNDPADFQNPADWRTEIYWPLAE